MQTNYIGDGLLKSMLQKCLLAKVHGIKCLNEYLVLLYFGFVRYCLPHVSVVMPNKIKFVDSSPLLMLVVR